MPSRCKEFNRDMNVALLFPGQGSQYVGMGRALWERSPAVQRLHQRASELLGFDVSRLCFEGPEERLNTTVYTQPLVYVAVISVLTVFEEIVGLRPRFVAGHSLGEYPALVAAGGLSFEDGLLLVQKRAAFMQEAVPPGRGGMAAILGLDEAVVEGICREAANGQVLLPANYNAPGQIVISGETQPLDRALAMARKKRAKALRLPVSAPFHSPLMRGAADRLAEALEKVTFQDLATPWVSNVTAAPVLAARDCRQLLVRQVCSPVRWEASIRWMIGAGVDRFVELGPRRVLQGLCRRIDPRVPCDSAESIDEIQALVARYESQVSGRDGMT